MENMSRCLAHLKKDSFQQVFIYTELRGKNILHLSSCFFVFPWINANYFIRRKVKTRDIKNLPRTLQSPSKNKEKTRKETSRIFVFFVFCFNLINYNFLMAKWGLLVHFLTSFIGKDIKSFLVVRMCVSVCVVFSCFRHGCG